MEKPRWYGLRTVYEHCDRKRGEDRLYEERIVLIRACSDDEAIEQAEKEAERYAQRDVRYLGYAMAFEMFKAPDDNIEVFSLMRESMQAPKQYLDSFFDTGRERTL